MRKQDLSYRYYLAENNLATDITIGVHLHENLGLAYSLAQHFLEISSPKRNITIDGSLLGMGRVPGNLCIEQIMDHLNYQYGKNYYIEPAYDAIDDFIAPIKKKIPWGYSIPYALSGKLGVHRTYAEYLMGKNRLRTKDIQRILQMIDRQHIELFDEIYVEELYRQYVNSEYDEEGTIDYLKKMMLNRDVVVICPGKSLSQNKDFIIQHIENNDSIVFTVNFVPEFINPDFVFCANIKRISNIKGLKDIPRIITSNLTNLAENNYEYIVSFNNCAYFNDEFCEDSTLMLFKVLLASGCNKISVAGFDGFVENGQNYYTDNYTNKEGRNVSAEKVKRILRETFINLELNFLTPSAYNEEDSDEN